MILHLLSIEEEQYLPQNDRIEQVRHHCQFKGTISCLVCFVLPIRTDHIIQDSPGRTNLPPTNGRTGLLAPKLELIGEDDTMETYEIYDPYGDDHSEHGDMDMDFLEVDLVRSTSCNITVLLSLLLLCL